MKYVVSLMSDTGNREDWQPIASLIIDCDPNDLNQIERDTLTNLEQTGTLNNHDLSRDEVYLWSTPLLAEVTNTADATTAFHHQSLWQATISQRIGKQDWPTTYITEWAKLQQDVTDHINQTDS